MEPALAAVLVAIAAYFIIDALGLKAFDPLVNDGDFTYVMVISFLNDLVLTFGGAWAGGTLQRTYAGSGEPTLAWGWIITGTIFGFAVSLFLVNAVIRLLGLVAGPFTAPEPGNAWIMLFTVFLGLQATGYVCAFRSPGDTSYEAAIAGLITLVLLIDVFVFSLQGETKFLTYGRIVLVLITGIVASLMGGYIGERVQAQAEGAR